MATPAITPQGVPMFGPDGAVHMVPPDQVQAATANGGEMAHSLRSPADGSVRYVRHSQLGQALQAGGVPVSMETTQTDVPAGNTLSTEQPPGAFSRFATSALGALGLPTSMGEVESRRQEFKQHLVRELLTKPLQQALLGPLFDILKSPPYSMQNLTNVRDAYNRGGGMGTDLPGVPLAPGIPAAVPYAIAGAVPFIGGTIQKGMKQADTGDIAGAAGTATGLAIPAIAGAMVESAVLPKVPLREMPIEHAQAVTRAVNPDPAVARQFQANFAQAAPDIKAAAERNGIDLSTDRTVGKVTEQRGINMRQNLADATKAAADEHKNYYYDTFVNPIRDEAVQVGADPRNTMTIGAMDQRLTDINALLNPKYDKGGAAARAALAPDQTVALQAEAANLRSRMNNYIGQRFGLDPADIAAQRQRFGVLYDLQDKMQQSASDSQYYANEAARNPSVNPFSKRFVVDRAVKAIMPNPDAAIGSAFENQLVPRDVPRPTQQLSPQNNYAPRLPLWDQRFQPQPSPTIVDTRVPQADNAAAVGRFQERSSEVMARRADQAAAKAALAQQIEAARRARLAKQGR